MNKSPKKFTSGQVKQVHGAELARVQGGAKTALYWYEDPPPPPPTKG